MPSLGRAISIYLHFPYCSQICTFCAFNKYRLPSHIDQAALTQSYITELSHGLKQVKLASDAAPVKIRSVYFGGGTPSLAIWLVRDVLRYLRSSGYDLSASEVTLEANPTSLPDVKLLQKIGVTRVSLGLQSMLDTKQLKRFNREHSAKDSQLALDRLARDVAYLSDGFSFDLMFANPLNDNGFINQEASITKELAVALPYAEIGGHVSLYELTVEHGTPLSREIKAGRILMPDEDYAADEYDAAVSFMVGAKFDHYEVSSFAKPGRYGRHNFAFWMHEDLIGIGPGAHGRLTSVNRSKYRTRCVPDPTRWATQIEAQGHGIARRDILGHSFGEECIAVGLRTEVGISRSRFTQIVGQPLESCLDMAQVKFLEQEGYVSWSESGIHLAALPREFHGDFKDGAFRATEKGRRVLDLITPMLLHTT